MIWGNSVNVEVVVAVNGAVEGGRGECALGKGECGGVEGGRSSVRWRGRVVEIVVAVDAKVVIAVNSGIEGGRGSVRWGGGCNAAGTAMGEKCALGMGLRQGGRGKGRECALGRKLWGWFAKSPKHGGHINIILCNLLSTSSVSRAYSSAGKSINQFRFLQCAAFLEVIHGAIGLVPSGALLPLMQWGGRTHFLLAIVTKLDEVQQLPSVFITFFAWSISEVIRYSHYAFSCIGNCPYWITYLRLCCCCGYTAFIVLYPLGVGPGEIWIMYRALSIVKKKNLYSKTFSGLRFSYYNFLKVCLTFCLDISTIIYSCN
ncbi:very-long-chain (3R)-3-hydroxyacyl-CoA dehydratase 2-like [Arachis ipaensis]|uniref:very-long-chain (3R)-3-hydroxyacyl-CoA dehydratase 2-like n=1 Tax=Arachis ipaensis TaxID=130454 RepID=UPI000A2B9894|nr:very-long-chain (3R)-3-hydroxyacyl-CoA dehydratase 2-like [Arachis ipaensis]